MKFVLIPDSFKGTLSSEQICEIAKEKVEKTYDEKKQKELFRGKVQIEKYHNKGAALNALEKRPELMKKLHAGAWFSAAGYLTCLNIWIPTMA